MKKGTISVRNSLLLLLTATIWGVAFVAQSVSMDYIGGFTFNAVRNLIGALTLLPVIWGLGKTKAPEEKKRIQASSDRKTLITGGICCGILLYFASNFQQFGIKYTSVGKAGFITACYIVIVPIIGIVYLDCCHSFPVWTLSSLSDSRRGICHRQGRTSGTDLCFPVFLTYPYNRPFLTTGRWCKNVLYPVSGLWNPLRNPGADL